MKKLLTLLLLIPNLFFASSHIGEEDLDILLKKKPKPSENIEPLYRYQCSLSVDSLNGNDLPTIYKFNLLNIIFEVREDSDWSIGDFRVDKNIKNSLRNTVKQQFIKTKNAINRGYFSNDEKHLTLIIDYFFKPAFGDAYNFDALNAQLVYMDESDKEVLISALDMLIVQNAYNQIDKIQIYDSALREEKRQKFISELVDTLEKKLQENNLIFTDNEQIEILIRDYESNRTPKSLVVNLFSEFDSLKFLGKCNLIDS